MPTCRRCSTDIPPRRRVCDDCKAGKVLPPDDAAGTADVEGPDVPKGLHPRGRELWLSFGQVAGTAAGELALEACRSADRLNELDRIIAGKGVMQLMQFRLDLDLTIDDTRNINVRVGFQEVLKEARLQQVALKDLLKELRAAIAAQSAAGKPPVPTPASPAAGGPVLSAVDQLAARRAEREQTTAGT